MIFGRKPMNARRLTQEFISRLDPWPTKKDWTNKALRALREARPVQERFYVSPGRKVDRRKRQPAYLMDMVWQKRKAEYGNVIPILYLQSSWKKETSVTETILRS